MKASDREDNWNLKQEDWLPDVRDGLSRVDRVVIYCLYELLEERSSEWAPSAQLYGRVVEHINITPEQLQVILARLGAQDEVR